MIHQTNATSHMEVLVEEKNIIKNKHKIERKKTTIACQIEVPTIGAKQ